MQINVAQLLKSPTGTVRDYEVDEIVACGGDEYLVKGKIGLTRTGQGILVGGTLRTETRITCSRCLCLFTCPLIFNITEEYFPTIDVSSGNPLPLPDEPGVFTIDEHHTLDLAEAICQYTLMSIPMKPLCQVDCPGLCPKCGKELKQGPCSCQGEEVDPRWAKLRDYHLTSSKGRKKSHKG